MKRIVLLFVLISGYAFSQTVNDYQYVMVPAKFNFLKNENQYRLNTLTKLLLQKYGFRPYLSNEELPIEIKNQRCSFLYADVVKTTGILITKLKVSLKDCYEKVVYETEFGTSREKEFVIAYNQALREAGKSFDKLNYKYNGKNGMASQTVTKQSNVTKLLQGRTEIRDVIASNPETLFFAQPIVNGFQIVNNESRIIMQLLYTSQKNVFIALKNDINGIVINKNGQWLFEYYENAKLKSKLLNLKF